MHLTRLILVVFVSHQANGQFLDVVSDRGADILNALQKLKLAQQKYTEDTQNEIEALKDAVEDLTVKSKKCCNDTKSACAKVLNVDTCPKDFIFRGKSCYKIINKTMDWWTAMKKCNELGGHLVDIESAEENAFVLSLMRMGAVRTAWTGANDLGVEGQFKWESTGDSVSYTQWMKNEPYNWQNKEHCVAIDAKGWNDAICTTRYQPICEKNARM